MAVTRRTSPNASKLRRNSTDADRTAFPKAKNFHVIRFWNNDVLMNMEGVLSVVLGELASVQAAPPSPNPLPPAGEG